MRQSSSHSQFISAAPIRWAVVLLAWVGFGLCAYLAWASLGHSPLAGCLGGSDCDKVQSSAWSVWIFVPVAMLGLACYATLAGLSLVGGMMGPGVTRWVGTVFVLLSLVAALSGLWFTAIQLFEINAFCLTCMAVHLCSFALVGLVLWSVLHQLASAPTARAGTGGLSALRAALPTTPGPGTAVTVRSVPLRPGLPPARPSLSIAAGGAAVMMVLLIGGQYLFPASTSIQETVTLSEPVRLDGSPEEVPDQTEGDQTEQATHVASRISTDTSPGQVVTASHEAVEPEGGAEDDVAPPEETGHRIPEETTPTGTASGSTSPADVPRPERLVSFLGGQLTLDISKHPLLGPLDAPHVVIEFVSYDCPHCRKMHRMVRKALSRYGDQVAVVIMFIPAEMECNKQVTDPRHSIPGACATARLALSVAQLDPSQFPKLHDWLMADPEKPPSTAQVVRRAQGLVDRDRLKKLSHEQLNRQIGQYVDLITKIQKQLEKEGKKLGLPLTILGDEIISGSLETEEEVFEAWENALGVKPVERRGVSSL